MQNSDEQSAKGAPFLKCFRVDCNGCQNLSFYKVLPVLFCFLSSRVPTFRAFYELGKSWGDKVVACQKKGEV